MEPDDTPKRINLKSRLSGIWPANVAAKQRLLMPVFLVILAGAAGFGGGWLASKNVDSISSTSATTQAKQQIVLNESNLISETAKNVGPSVVSVDTTSQSPVQSLFGFGGGAQQQEGAGTGVILTADGIVITNRHVVPSGTTTVSITLSDGTKLDSVDVLGRTSDSDPLDVAFLKIKDTKGKKLTPVVIGDSSKVQVGDKVIAIGNALGQFQNTVTSGIISGYGRSVQAGDGSGLSSTAESLQNLFQTDAAINPGNSGGPLVNVNGEMIGINTAVADAQNIGFAIPINDVKGLITSVEKNGKLERPYLGVRYVALTDDIAYFYNLDVKRGAYIAPSQDGSSAIVAGSPAEKAGLKEKDIITKVDNTAIDETNSLTSLLGQHNVGDTVTLTINRGGKEQTIKVTLAASPQQ